MTGRFSLGVRQQRAMFQGFDMLAIEKKGELGAFASG